ncbi:siderophore ABC transporter substrate-binding protein [Anaerobacillus alkaliphilus]|uniref:Siderophore ABC transporter substrate-binding protein n=1 Tax=Anaerobacillus alkaliphilus TaxID=1548597 RepID=A0A4Q0VNM1_9BACI|nr:siderophore ABC transporter substrate-binding protein [Anaerobacillus alkaliphilus]RXI97748.1 siderophore ABC transporter substrate-binding protein [Anaerobacillus alkaliphilus]
MKKIFFTLVAFLLVITIAACGTKDATSGTTTVEPTEPVTESTVEVEAQEEVETEVTVKHQLGETVVPKNPEKVVVFDFGVLDSLDKIGVEVFGLPQANIPPYLSKFADAKYVNTGSLKEPDFEAIANEGANLIIISGRQQELYPEFSKLAPTVYMAVDNANYMESFKNNMTILGQIFDREDVIEAELAQIDASIAELNQKASSVENVLIVLANEGNISAYGPGSRFGILHGLFGFTPVDDTIEVSTHGMNISYEYLLEKDPEYLFVVDRGAVVAGGESAAKQTIENELTEKTRAYQDGKIVYLDPNYWYLSGGGLVSVSEMIREISEGVK